ncbi:MAG TPA: VOC family protein [Brevundimonas sp.]|jgi:hypothetical protein|uniref:VOC family protein n=1 Tax=Brevundimonas sp. TaxID=1871086 RepID=UPI002E10E45C|nr:VOC family protein [Brevundimonas sp.]
MPEFYGAGHGDFFWHELTTPDPEGGAEFYRRVLGWESVAQPMGDFTYRFFQRDGQRLGGIMAMEGDAWKGIAPHWMLYVAVADIEAAKAEVTAAGGRVLHGPFDAPGVGRMMVISDPQDAVLTLIQPAPEMAAGA